MAQSVLTKFQEHPDAWTRTDTILETAQSAQTKFYALIVLGNAIKVRWKTLPREQRDGIKTYLIQLIFKLSYDDATLQSQRVLVHKLDQTLVQVRR